MKSKKRKILITGGSGFIGTNLILKLKSMPFDILNVSLEEPKVPVKTLKIDLTKSNFDFLDKYEFDYVVHLAALSNHRMCQDLEKTFETNVAVPFKLLNKLLDKNIKKIILMSSIVVYADDVALPIKESAKLNIYRNNYNFAKGIDEEICNYFRKNYNLPILTFCLSNIYGPYQDWKKFPNLLPQIISQAIRDKEIVIWNETPIRDWIYVEDSVKAIIKAFESNYNGIMNLGTGKGVSVGKVVKFIAKLTNSKIRCLNKQVTGPKKVICDINLIRKELKWRPKVSLEEGLKRTIRYYQGIIKHAD
jgi:nucleoside-diphosphate-sugar epimerase